MLNSQGRAQHARLVESVARGRLTSADVPDAVRRSWSRCFDSYSLEPNLEKKPTVVDRAELQARRAQIGAVLPIARIEMVGLCRHLQQTDFGLMLTDGDGVILHYVGDPGFTATARRSGLREGAIWSERELGTNGMGTCLIEQRAVVIHQAEHFLLQNTALTCSAAPIFDLHGNILAALDYSGGGSPAQSHTLALVAMAAQNIENRVLLDACRQHYALRFHRRAEFVSTPGEGVVAFDGEGCIVGANRSALEMLDLPDHKSLIGQPMESYFNTTPAMLMQWSARRGLRCEPIVLRLGNQRMWGAIQGPDMAPRTSVPAAAHGQTAAVAASHLLPNVMEFGDPATARNIRMVRRVIDTDLPVMLLGETGTGKGYFARAIHQVGHRGGKPFVSVNCAAIPESLIESELFGYKPGAFTGATREGHDGLIVQANGGTLFLDEIGDMPLSLQVRLLGVVEDREVVPLGGTKPVPVDIRIISATHRDLRTMIAEGRFREDLYYRLDGLALRLPPLRERRDVAGIIEHLLRAEAGERPVDIDDALIQKLLSCPWPGNLRQLRHALRTMLALCETHRLTLADFNEEWARQPNNGRRASDQPAAVAETADVLGAAERQALQAMLEACNGNVSAAAIRLNVSRKTLYRKMHRHGLLRSDGTRRSSGTIGEADRVPVEAG